MSSPKSVVAIYGGTWAEDCLKHRGKVLTGSHRHYCAEWDDLPVDNTCPEWPCNCVLPHYETGTDLAGNLSSTLTPDGRVIVAFLLRLFRMDPDNAAHVQIAISILKCHEDVE